MWEALLEKMPMTAMVRNLGKMSAIGLIKPLSSATKSVCERLRDGEYLKKSRMHPLNIFIALKTYGQGHGGKGKLTWTAAAEVVGALEDAFYAAFGFLEPANKRTLIGLDVSSSMTTQIPGQPVSSCEAAAVMSMVVARTEPQYHIMGFAHDFRDLKITAKDSLREAAAKAQTNFGATNIPLPMQWAQANKIEVDTFAVYTDGEVNVGTMHVCQALQAYRNAMGINSRLVVQAFTATNFSVADPIDPLMLDIIGLDSASPQLTSDFSAGRI